MDVMARSSRLVMKCSINKIFAVSKKLKKKIG